MLFVHISGEVSDYTSQSDRRMLIVDLLPAGFEIESISVGKGVKRKNLVIYLNYQKACMFQITMTDL